MVKQGATFDLAKAMKLEMLVDHKFVSFRGGEGKILKSFNNYRKENGPDSCPFGFLEQDDADILVR